MRDPGNEVDTRDVRANTNPLVSVNRIILLEYFASTDDVQIKYFHQTTTGFIIPVWARHANFLSRGGKIA